jgi:hypothetical protein
VVEENEIVALLGRFGGCAVVVSDQAQHQRHSPSLKTGLAALIGRP